MLLEISCKNLFKKRGGSVCFMMCFTTLFLFRLALGGGCSDAKLWFVFFLFSVLEFSSTALTFYFFRPTEVRSDLG